MRTSLVVSYKQDYCNGHVNDEVAAAGWTALNFHQTLKAQHYCYHSLLQTVLVIAAYFLEIRPARSSKVSQRRTFWRLLVRGFRQVRCPVIQSTMSQHCNLEIRSAQLTTKSQIVGIPSNVQAYQKFTTFDSNMIRMKTTKIIILMYPIYLLKSP